MIGRGIGSAVSRARDFLARRLIALHVTPNALTLTGIALTGAAGVCYALGAGAEFAWSFDPLGPNAYLPVAGVVLLAAFACDMLDGAVARLGGRATRFGAFLDSTLDRYSDFAVYAGIAAYYAAHHPANVTFVLLAMLAMFNSFMISYTRARAEDIIRFCTVGYWQRGERSAAILIATFSLNVPALLVQQALGPPGTVWRRIAYTKAIIDGKIPIIDPREGGWRYKIRLWRWERMTIPYDIVTGINVAWLIFAPVPTTDWLSRLFGG